MAMTKRPPRRGVALLVTLAALVLTVTAAAILAELAATTRLQRRLHDRVQLANDLVLALARPIEHWLANESRHVVLPPGVSEPAVSILFDLLLLDGHEVELRITAWDQCGMASLASIAAGSPLRLALDDDVLRGIDDLEPRGDAPLGLDLLIGDTEDGQARLAVFPDRPLLDDDPVAFTHEEVPQREPSQLLGQDDHPRRPAIGSRVSTYPRKGARARMNVNTAPIELLEAAMRLAGRGGLDVITAARSEGRPVTLGTLPASTSSDDTQSLAPDFVGASDAWAFRLDIRIDNLRRSWWVVYVNQSSTWECVQRVAIPY